jgi:hypothetical protein
VAYLLLAVPWFAAVQLRYPGFLRYMFLSENLERYAGKYHSDYPPGVYAIVILGGMSLWTLSLLATGWRDRHLLRELKAVVPGAQERLYLWLWFWVIFLFFTLGKGRLPTYVLPCFPALALLVGREWATAFAEGRAAPAARWQRAVVLAAAGALLFCGAVVFLARHMVALTPGQQWTGALWLTGSAAVGIVLCGAALRQGSTRALFGALTASGAVCLLACVQTAHIALGADDVAPLARTAARLAGPQDQILMFDANKMTAFHYYVEQATGGGRRVEELPPTLAEPVSGQPVQKKMGKVGRKAIAALLQEAQSSRGLYCLIKTRTFRHLRPQLAAAGCDTVLGRNRQYVLITNRPAPLALGLKRQ